MKLLSSDAVKSASPLQPMNTLRMLTWLPILSFTLPTVSTDDVAASFTFTFNTVAELPPQYTSPLMSTESFSLLPIIWIFTLLVIGLHELMFTIFRASLAALCEGMFSLIGTVNTNGVVSDFGSFGLSG